MEAIVKAIQPCIDGDRSCDFSDWWNDGDRIKQAFYSAQREIKASKEEIANVQSY